MTSDMIDLGLSRIAALVPAKFPWRAVHVAGTNGKGSICAYLSSIMTPHVKTGRFTTPHLLAPHDSVYLNNKPCEPSLFKQTEASVLSRARSLNITPTPFELLTATAFEMFTEAGVEVAIVEVGVGGRLDATNVIRDPLCSVITSIAMDHANLLGDTIEKIAGEKAGIIKPGAPVVVDAANGESVKRVITAKADAEGAGTVRFVSPLSDSPTRVNSKWGELHLHHLPGKFQSRNAAIAVAVAEEVSVHYPELTGADVVRGIAETRWPGRLEHLDISALVGGEGKSVLLDGAHNLAAAKALREYVDELYPSTVTWIFAFSAGKDVREMLDVLLRDGDDVAVTGFGTVEGMPWVKCVAPEEAAQVVREVGRPVSTANDVVAAVKKTAEGVKPVVVAGSLYLGSELARAVAAAKQRGKVEE